MWVTGGGHEKDANGKKNAWSLSGNAMSDAAGGLIGNFQIRDFANKTSYHLDTITSLTFSGPETGSPYAPNNSAVIVASGYDKDGDPISATITIVDVQEPGKGNDSMEWAGTGGLPSLGTTIIDGGNFQIHAQ
ncbi:hypothetical protein ACFLVE_03730 [Chloroflexota bacterium]